MADETVVHIGENSPERIAYLLYKEIQSVEKNDRASGRGRKWILDTYAECILAVKAPQRRGSSQA